MTKPVSEYDDQELAAQLEINAQWADGEGLPSLSDVLREAAKRLIEPIDDPRDIDET